MAVFLWAVEVNDAVPEEMVRRMWENLPPQRRSRLERQKNAEKALEAGASGIVVSNHGGRVLDHCPATAEVLPDIVDAVGGKMTIFVDGAIRSGMDMFKALALGADAVLIGRPFVTTVYGGGEEGVQLYVQKLKAELADTMRMCGAHSLADIDRSMLYGF